MSNHTGMPMYTLILTLLLLTTSPVSALDARRESQQLRGSHVTDDHEMPAKVHYEIPAKAGDKEAEADKEDDEDNDQDDEESDEDKAEEKKRESKEAQLKKELAHAKNNVRANLREQKQIASQIHDFEHASEGNAFIATSVKEVANETASSGMAEYMGDMWKEMRMFANPFYQVHLMERREILKKQEKGLHKLLTAAQLKLKLQKLDVEKEDAQEDANDEANAQKKEEDLEKVAKVEKEEKKAKAIAKKKDEAEEKESASMAEEDEVEEDDDDFGKPPWMKNRKEKKVVVKKQAKPAPDNTVTPDWMKALESDDDESA